MPAMHRTDDDNNPLLREARGFSDLLFHVQDKEAAPITSESCRRLWDLARVAYITSANELVECVFCNGEVYTPRMWRSLRRAAFHQMRDIERVLRCFEEEE